MVVAPPGVLGGTAGDVLPLVALDGGVADLERHLADEVLPPLLNEVHDGAGLLGRGERCQDGDAFPAREPAEVHPCRTNITNKKTTLARHEIT